MSPGENLSGRLRWVFVRQALLASALLLLGVAITGMVLRDALLRQRALVEMDNAWALVERDASLPLPASSDLETYFVPAGAMPDQVPPQLRALSPGLHRTEDGKWHRTHVSERAAGRLYMRIAPGMSDRLVVWMLLAGGSAGVIGIWILSWLGYRRSRRVVAPVASLTRRVLAWDPQHGKGRDFHVEAPADANTWEVVSLGDALASMAERMEAYVERERNFTRDASHELRTPLTVIAVAADLLGSQPLEPRARRSLERIRLASRDMGEVLDALLLLARNPDEPVAMEQVTVLDIAHEEAGNAREWLGEKPVAVTVEAQAPLQVEAPPRVIATILSQFLRNACRFTETGSIHIRLCADAVHVCDTGIGMDAQTLARVFEPFWRADISDYHAKGMGLTLARRLAERFGWEIVLTSAPGEGTTASLYFQARVNP